MISYVVWKPPFSRGRCGLAARAWACRRTTRVHFASESVSSSLYNANAVLYKHLWGSSTICARAYRHTHVVFHSRLWSRERCALTLTARIDSGIRVARRHCSPARVHRIYLPPTLRPRSPTFSRFCPHLGLLSLSGGYKEEEGGGRFSPRKVNASGLNA